MPARRALALPLTLAALLLAGCASPGPEEAGDALTAPQAAVVQHVRETETNVSLRASDFDKADAYRTGANQLRADRDALLAANDTDERDDDGRFAEAALAHARWYEAAGACLDAQDPAARPCQDVEPLRAEAKRKLQDAGVPAETAPTAAT